MGQSPNIESFRQAFVASQPDGAALRPYSDVIWTFGDTSEVATKVGHLARAGIKTATSGLLWEMERDGEAPPRAGDIAIVADGDDEPLCIIEITEVVIKPCNEIDESFAFDYGENDRTLKQWRADSWDYFAQVCAGIEREPSGTMPLVCQRFRLLYPKN